MTVLIPARLKALAGLASKDKTRYSINAIQLRRLPSGQACAEATDGKHAVRVTWNDAPYCEEFPVIPGLSSSAKPGFTALVAPESFLEWIKAIPAKFRIPILGHVAVDEQASNGTIEGATTDLGTTRRISIKTVEGQYPDVTNCIPTHKAASVSVDPLRLAKVLLAIADVMDTGGATATVRLTLCDKLDPIRIDGKDCAGLEALALVMPINTDDDPAPSREEA